MTRILLSIFLSLFFLTAYSQERNDGMFIVHLMETDSEDLKCEIGVTHSHIVSLMNNGRHVISAVPTKFGMIALHEKAKQGTDQKYIHIPSYNLKKEAKQYFKEGYIIENYNDMSDYAIFTKNTNITKQTYLGQPSQKKVAKQNKKGIYVLNGCKTEAIGQDKFENFTAQERIFYVFRNNFLSDFKEMSEAGYIIGSVQTSYNRYDNNTYYTVIYDKPKEQYKGKQILGILETKEEFVEFVQKHVKGNFNIKGIWGGWENRDYAAIDAIVSKPSESAFDVLLGLGNSILQLTNGPQSSYSNTTEEPTNSSTPSKSNSSCVGKCRTCGGSGTCTAKTASGRKNACNGSGLCGHCSGTGWIKAGGSEAICTACNGKGKCKSCHGTGKCKTCNGTGK